VPTVGEGEPLGTYVRTYVRTDGRTDGRTDIRTYVRTYVRTQRLSRADSRRGIPIGGEYDFWQGIAACRGAESVTCYEIVTKSLISLTFGGGALLLAGDLYFWRGIAVHLGVPSLVLTSGNANLTFVCCSISFWLAP
jgi:hypothetical protein